MYVYRLYIIYILCFLCLIFVSVYINTLEDIAKHNSVTHKNLSQTTNCCY